MGESAVRRKGTGPIVHNAYMRVCTCSYLLVCAAMLAAQNVNRTVREGPGCPQAPPLITFLGLMGEGSMAADPSVPLKGPVVRVVFEEFQGKAVGQATLTGAGRIVTTEYDGQ